MYADMISVIIPVYNTEAYLQRCVESVLMQTYSPLEVLLIDDGSTDGSGALCDALAQKHSEITVFHRGNHGAAISRNFGIQQAKGMFLLFLDSDDVYLQQTALEQLHQAAVEQNSDMVCFCYARVKNGEETAPVSAVSHTENVFGEKMVVVPRLIEQNLYTSSSCLKLSRQNLITDNHIRFAEASRCEDIVFSMQLLLYARKPVYLDACLYGYTVRDGSTTRTCNAKTVLDTLSALDWIKSAVPQEDVLYGAYMSYVAFQYCTLLINAQLARPKTEKVIWRRIYAQRALLQFHENRIVRLVFRCSRVVGLRMTAKLLLIYFKISG